MIEICDIESVECIGNFEDEYVYDIEMEDDTTHTFFGNDILIHNSNHMSLTKVMAKESAQFYNEDGTITKYVYDRANEINDYLNDEIVKWGVATLNSADPRFYFKREAICPMVLYQKKKHYVMHIKDKGERNPIPCDKIKPVGIALVKSTLSEESKVLIKKIVKIIFNTRDRVKTNSFLRKVYSEFKDFDVFQIAVRSNINNLEEYTSKSDGIITPKGCPIHVKSAIYYNYLLAEFGLTAKYNKIKSGIKIKYVYVMPNKYNIKSIAFIDTFPKEFEAVLTPDYGVMFEKIVKKPIKALYDCAKWNIIDVKNEVHTDLLDFFSND